MKYRLICLAVVAVILAGGLLIGTIQPNGNRYHQHLEERPYTPCSDHGDEVFCTHLPLFNIVTDAPIPAPYLIDETGQIQRDENGRSQFNNEMVAASVAFFANPEGNNHLTDTPNVSERALIRVRGNTSRAFDKKSYLLKFTTADGSKDLDVPLDGMVADNSWVLHGPILDKTLIRNYLCYNISGELMDYVPEVRFCELYLNGAYQGVYVLTEKIKYNPDGRCTISKTDPKLRQTSFILLMDRGTKDESHSLQTFLDNNGTRGLSSRATEHFEIVYPGLSLTTAQKEYIATTVSQLEKALYSFDSSDRQRGYPAYLDVDSFVNYYVLNQFFMNSDAGHLSTYFVRDVRGKIQIVGWDYNNTFNNFFNDLLEGDDFFYTNKWYACMLRDEWFVNQVEKQYRKLRDTVLNDDYLEAYIAQTIDYLGPAVERNNARWGYTYSLEYCENHPEASLRPIERNPETYDGAVAQLLEAIEQRSTLMDENIHALRANCHASVNKQFQYQGEK